MSNSSKRYGLLAKAIYILVAAGIILGGFLALKYLIPSKNVLEQVNDSAVKAIINFTDDAPTTLPDTVIHYRFKIFNFKESLPNLEQLKKTPLEIPLVITLEPWGSGANNYFDNSLRNLQAGHYDQLLADFCAALPQDQRTIYLRFAPEMEVPSSKYPWQQYPDLFIKAYRHFAEICRKHANEAKLVWSPAGYPGAMEYYPGGDVIDAASVTINATSEAGLSAYPKLAPTDDLRRRLHRLRDIAVPILVLAKSAPVTAQKIATSVRLAEEHILMNKDIYSLEKPVPLDHKRSAISDEIIFGVYDPQSLLNDHKAVSVEHLFLDFRSLINGEFSKNFSASVKRQHDVIVTFEPFRLPEAPMDTMVLSKVIAGNYDAYFSALKDILSSTTQRVYLRYAHEMEIPIHRYPWQSQEPVIYIRSFRYFMKWFADLPNVVRVWGPAGDRGSIEWYPGDEWVDYCSIAIYGLPDKNITDPKKQEKFSTIFHRKTWRLRFIDKPLFITEFGVKGSDEFQRKWLTSAAETLRNAPGVVGVNYFNMSDSPKAWGDIPPPDWGISKNTLEAFIEELAR